MADLITKYFPNITARQREQFDALYDLYADWNAKINVISRKDITNLYEHHVLHSLAIAKFINFRDDTNVLDLGTGGGFPGIPLAIAFPALQLTLMDSLNKRVVYLTDEIKKLGLNQHTAAIHARAEDLARQAEQRETYEYCTSRAVARLSVLSEFCLPFVKVGGQMIAYKAGDIAEELSDAKYAIRKLGGEPEQVISFSLPEDAGERSLVVIRKYRETPAVYPRKAGMPAKEPLCNSSRKS